MTERTDLARAVYDAWRTADRERAEALYAPEFTFASPVDPALDRDGWFARCWPAAGRNANRFEFRRLVESGDEVIVTYVATRPDGTRFQNTEILGFAGDQIVRCEVYFGWDLGAATTQG